MLLWSLKKTLPKVCKQNLANVRHAHERPSQGRFGRDGKARQWTHLIQRELAEYDCCREGVLDV